MIVAQPPSAVAFLTTTQPRAAVPQKQVIGSVEGESPTQSQPSTSAAKPYVVIIGFGVPGRAVAELLHFSGVDYCVVEKNEATVRRCAKGHEHIIPGDATDGAVLKNAGVDRATMIVVALPDEEASLAVTR